MSKPYDNITPDEKSNNTILKKYYELKYSNKDAKTLVPISLCEQTKRDRLQMEYEDKKAKYDAWDDIHFGKYGITPKPISPAKKVLSTLIGGGIGLAVGLGIGSENVDATIQQSISLALITGATGHGIAQHLIPNMVAAHKIYSNERKEKQVLRQEAKCEIIENILKDKIFYGENNFQVDDNTTITFGFKEESDGSDMEM